MRVVELEHSAAGIATDKHVDQHDYDTAAPTFLPDILADLQNETDLTRATLVRILRESGRLADFAVNPQAFTVLVDDQDQRSDAQADGRRHPVRADARAALGDAPAGARGERGDRAVRGSRSTRCRAQAKTLYDHIEIESEVERRFAKGLDDNQHVGSS